jgi:hypothetical protein
MLCVMPQPALQQQHDGAAFNATTRFANAAPPPVHTSSAASSKHCCTSSVSLCEHAGGNEAPADATARTAATSQPRIPNFHVDGDFCRF